MREQTLDRLIRLGVKAVVVGIVAVGAIYVIQRSNTSPTLVERQVSAAEAAVRANPTATGLRLKLAAVYRAAHRREDALGQYAAVLKIEPHQTTALLGRGEVLSEEGELPAAAGSFEKIIGSTKGQQFAQVNPQLEAAYYGLASVKLKRGDPKDAVRAARRATKIEPGDADALYVLGSAELKAHNYGRAVNALRQAVLFVPSGWCEPYERLAVAYRGQKRKQEAQYAGAMVELCERKPAAAAARLKRLTSGPAARDAMLGLGMAAEAQSQRDAAIRWYRKVVASEPDNFNARVGLSRLGVKTGGE